MTRGVRLYLVGSLVLVALAGCGRSFMQFAEREPWRREAEVQCLKSGAVKEGPAIVRAEPIEGPGVCGADFPLKVAALGGSGSALGFGGELRPPGSIPNASQPRWPIARTPAPPAAEPPLDYRNLPPSRDPALHGGPMVLVPPSQADPAPRPQVSPSYETRSYPEPRSYPETRPARAYPPEQDTPPKPRDGYDPYAVEGAPGRDRNYGAPRTIEPRSIEPPRQQPSVSRQQLDPYAVDAPERAPSRNSRGRDSDDRSWERTSTPPLQTAPPALGPARGTVTGSVAPAAVKPAATLACPLVSALDAWIADAVQPAAQRWFGQQVAEIRQISAYSCRGMNGQPGARISEHAFGNALDISSFILADGRKITVKNGWRGLPEEQGFLRDVQAAACNQFTTVLAPGSNRFHYDHIHVDLMRRASGRRICNPSAESGEEVAARAAGGRYVRRGEPGITGSIPNWKKTQTRKNPKPMAFDDEDWIEDKPLGRDD